MPTAPRQKLTSSLRALTALLLVLTGQLLSAQTYSWAWARGIMGSNEDEITALATDGTTGDVITVGYTKSSGIISTNQAGTVSGSQDAFVRKYNSSGGVLWGFTPSGNGESQATAVAVDGSGNVYVTGWFKNTIDMHGLSVLGSGTLNSSGDNDWFIASYASDGSLRWRTKLGGSGKDVPTGIAVAGGTVSVFGTIRGRISTAFGQVSNSLPSNTDNLVVVNYGSNGTGNFLLSAGSSGDEASKSITASQDQIFVGYRAKGGDDGIQDIRWFGPSGNLMQTLQSSSFYDLRITAFSLSGAFQWSSTLSETNSSSLGTAAMVAGCNMLFVTGITHAPTTFPGVASLATATQDQFYVARMDPANGSFEWVTTGTSTGSNQLIGGTGIAIGKSGIVHVSGNFKNDISIGGTTLTSTTGKVQPFIASFRSNGLIALGQGMTSSSDAWSAAIATDAEGNVLIGGRFESNISAGSSSLSGPSTQNGFLFKGLLPSVGGSDPTSWTPPTAMCSDRAPIDLNALLTPAGSGGATVVTNSNNVINAGSALGFVQGYYANYNTPGGYVTVDLGTTLAIGSTVSILWRTQGGFASAQASSGLTPNPPANANGNLTTTSTNAVYSSFVLSAPARYVRITRAASGSANFDLDGIYYSYGNDMSGTWSGTGVSGSTFNPTGLSGAINVTYTVGSGSCASATTHPIQVTAAPNAGLNGTLSTCSTSPASDLLLQLGGSPVSTGSWSGPSSISGGMYDPASMVPGNYSYTVTATGICTGSATATVAVSVGVSPSGGTFTGGGVVCPSPATGTVSISGYSGSIISWNSSTDGGANWTPITNITNQLNWSNLSGITQYRVELGQVGCGNGFSPTVTLTPHDVIAPVLICPAVAPVSNSFATGTCTMEVPSFLGMYTATDNCSTVITITQTPVAGSFIPFAESAEVLMVATDASGNVSTTCSATIIGIDTLSPVAACPANVTLNTGSASCTASHTVVPITYTDNCWGSGIAEKVFMAAGVRTVNIGSIFDPVGWTEITSNLDQELSVGAHTIVFVHEGGVEDVTLCSYTVSVLDNSVPVFSDCPIDITLIAGPSCTAIASWTAPSITDNCTNPLLTQAQGPSNGDPFPIGTTEVRFMATDGTNSATCSFIVTVTPPPPPTITGNLSFCTGNSTVLTSSSSTNNMWSNGATTQSIIVTSAGSYSVAIDMGGCISSGATVVVNELALPATPTISGPSSLCAGGSITLTSSSATGNVWSPGGQTSQSITVNATGNYSVTVTNAAGCSSSSISKVITQNASPPVPLITGSNSFCAGTSTTLTSSIATGNVWSNGATTQSITINTAGTYSVTVTNGAGCTVTSANKVITIDALPATPTISGMLSFCAGTNTLLTSSSATDNLWSNGAITQSITVSTTGTYSVTVTNSAGCTATSAQKTITQTPLPPAPTTGTYSAQCITAAALPLNGNPSGGVWSGTGVSGNTFDPSVGSQLLTYTVTVGGCSNSATVTISAGPCDCAGVINGTAFIDNCSTCVGGNTGAAACVADCNGDFGGTAFLDNCATCVGGNTGVVACVADCNGDFGGTAFLDNCATCVGGNTGVAACVADCNGDFGGTAFLDNCATCVGGNTGVAACVADCNGDFGGTAFLDNCATCVGGNTGVVACVADCNGDFGGTAFLDNCATCVGGNTGVVACVADCNGDFGGTAFLDNCATCVGGNTGVIACVADCNGDFGGTAFLDNCSTCVGGNTGVVACVADCNGDFGGTAFLDNCATCVGGNTGELACVADCNGDFGGTAFLDNCATCVGGNTAELACLADCNGDFGGTAFLDNCATCVGGNTGELACQADCNGDFGGTAFLDNCATCVGGNTGAAACVADCNGDFGGTAFLDNCATCVGGNTGEVACVADCNGDFGGTAFIDNCSTCVGGNTGGVACVADCNGEFGGNAFFDNCATCVGGNTGEVACVADCAAVYGGSALPGTTCDDGNESTTGDIWNTACECVGTMITVDCFGVPGGSALPGTPCNDNNSNTINDLWTSDCNCAGTPVTLDCLGLTNGTALPGNPCDDGNAGTTGDVWNTACECVGTMITVDCLGVPGGSALPGTTCNDNNANTINDAWTSDCTCEGTVVVFDCLGVANGPALTGTPCDDGNSSTNNDIWSSDCNCAGTAVSCSSEAGPDQVICGTSTSMNAEGSGTWHGPSSVNFSDLHDPTTYMTAELPGAYALIWTVSVPGCTATDTVQITFLHAPLANAGPDAEVCGNEFRMQATTGQNGHWTAPAGISASSSVDPNAEISVLEYGMFKLLWTVVQGACSTVDTVSITFHDPGMDVTVDAGPDQHLEVDLSTMLYGSVSEGATVEWTVLQGTGSFSAPDALTTNVSGLSLGTNTFVLTASVGPCISTRDTIVIDTKELFIPEGFSPNGDGDNDRFVVTGLDAYPNTDFTVFNRWGQKVYETNAYSNEWDGHSRNGQELPNDTYFYVLNLSGETAYNGFVVIKR